jgi:drug/metabolite transporter (DMT)-like permease
MSLKTKIALAFAIVYVVWGSTYLAIRIGLESMPPFLMAGFRFLVAGGFLWAWCDLRREPRPTLPQSRNAGLVGLLLVTLGNGLVTLGEGTVPSGIAALIVAIGPVFTALLLWMRGGLRPSGATVAGLVLGLAGVGLLMIGGEGGRVDPLGAGLIVAATFSWSCGVLVSQARELPVSNLRSNAVQMLVGGATMLLIGLVRGESVRPERVTLASALALVYLIVFGALLAYTTYAWLLREVSATAAGTTAYVNPAVAVALGALWGETIGVKAVLAMAAIFGGVWLLKRSPQTPKALAPATEG